MRVTLEQTLRRSDLAASLVPLGVGSTADRFPKLPLNQTYWKSYKTDAIDPGQKRRLPTICPFDEPLQITPPRIMMGDNIQEALFTQAEGFAKSAHDGNERTRLGRCRL